jgi:membrane protease YdiL (CAAX protease family)
MEAILISHESKSVEVSINNRVFMSVLALTCIIPVALFTITGLASLDTNPILKYLRVIVAAIMLFGIAVWGLRKEHISFDAIGLNLQNLREAILLIFAGWAIMTAVKYLAVVAGRGNTMELFNSSPLSIVQQWVFVGIAEEVLFRGYILTRLAKIWATSHKAVGLISAVAVSSLLFATAHIPQRLYQVTQGEMALAEVLGGVIVLLIPGIVFSYLFLRTKNILLVGLIHGSINVPLVGIGEDAFLPLIIVIIPYIEAFLFLKRRRLRGTISEDSQFSRLLAP